MKEPLFVDPTTGVTYGFDSGLWRSPTGALHASFQAGVDRLLEAQWAPTIAEGTAIRQPVRIQQMLAALRDTGGGTVAVSEDAIRSASMALAGHGLYVEPTSALGAAGYAQLIEHGMLDTDEETVVILTGSGLKATPFYASLS